ncbi:MAG: hypothetical protein EBW00_06205 [Proteobacteria bacterium]|nr:hypothetical protein [Pseudomonadota bacterium]
MELIILVFLIMLFLSVGSLSSVVIHRLILMEVGTVHPNGKQGLNHFVSEVSATAPRNRITYSGWWG